MRRNQIEERRNKDAITRKGSTEERRKRNVRKDKRKYIVKERQQRKHKMFCRITKTRDQKLRDVCCIFKEF